MTGKERYLRTLRGEPVDFIARTPILMQYAAEHIGSNYGAFAADHRVLVEANLACARDFGMDQVSCISDPYRETEGFGAEITYVRDGVPRASAPLAARRDLDGLRAPSLETSPRMRDRVDAVTRYRETVGEAYSILGWIEGPAAEAADLRTPVNFLTDVLDDPAYACELMDRCVEAGIRFARDQVAAGADTIGIGDAIASQLSPRLYEAYVLPREAVMVQAIQAMGAKVKLHICGKINHLLKGIAGLGVDILDVDHMVDLARVRSLVGPRVVIAGNIDPVGGVCQGSPESIRAAVRRCYEQAGYPFLVNAGCEIPSGTPPENLRALCEPVAYAGAAANG